MRRAALPIPTLAVAIALCLPAPAWGHGDPLADMPLTAQALNAPTPSPETIAHAARADIAGPVASDRAACLRLVHWLRTLEHGGSPPVLRDNAAAIRTRIIALQRADATGFWPHVCLAALDEQVADYEDMARALERALEAASADGIPAQVVVHATGFLGHALQAGDHLDAARATFRALRDDPAEGPHALAHLGRIAARTRGVATAVDIWLSHPAGPAAAASLIAREADALWRQDPDRSYQAVAHALRRLDRDFPRPSPELVSARARLLARTRENAMPPRH